MTDWDDDYESPEEYEAAQRRAGEPPDWVLELEAEEAAVQHRLEVHGGGECDCSPHEPPPCRLLLRLPRWSPRQGWHCGTPGRCDVAYCATPLTAWTAHRIWHTPPF